MLEYTTIVKAEQNVRHEIAISVDLGESRASLGRVCPACLLSSSRHFAVNGLLMGKLGGF